MDPKTKYWSGSLVCDGGKKVPIIILNDDSPEDLIVIGIEFYDKEQELSNGQEFVVDGPKD